MGILKSFFKREKAPEIPKISLPGLGDYEQYGPIHKLATSRLKGEGLGFGDQFVDRATNPVVTEKMRRFNESTVPTLSNQASARGLGRSNLATNSIQRAERDNSSDIDQLISNFYVLNENQKKRDTSEAVGIETGLLDRATNRTNAQAAIDINTPQQQFAMNQSADKTNYAKDQGLLSTLGTLVGGAFGGPLGASAGSKMGGAPMDAGSTANIQGSSAYSKYSEDEIDQLLSKYGGGY